MSKESLFWCLYVNVLLKQRVRMCKTQQRPTSSEVVCNLLSCSPDGFPGLSYDQILTSPDPDSILSASLLCSSMYCFAPPLQHCLMSTAVFRAPCLGVATLPLHPTIPLEECCHPVCPAQCQEQTQWSCKTKVIREGGQNMLQIQDSEQSYSQGVCY